jgi:hypothetical protein
MEKQTINDSKNGRAGNPKRFSSVTSHLRSKDFKWLKEDMGFFDLPENWDLEFRNDNQKQD